MVLATVNRERMQARTPRDATRAVWCVRMTDSARQRVTSAWDKHLVHPNLPNELPRLLVEAGFGRSALTILPLVRASAARTCTRPQPLIAERWRSRVPTWTSPELTRHTWCAPACQVDLTPRGSCKASATSTRANSQRRHMHGWQSSATCPTRADSCLDSIASSLLPGAVRRCDANIFSCFVRAETLTGA
jgi:hypothetical protein